MNKLLLCYLFAEITLFLLLIILPVFSIEPIDSTMLQQRDDEGRSNGMVN